MRGTADDNFALAAATVTSGFRDALVSGLSGSPKTIPSKYFYDVAGAQLFERICETPEYYPTRIELSLLRTHSAAIAQLAGTDFDIIEFGAGAGEKIRILLDVFTRPRTYVPVDISADWLKTVAEQLRRDYPALEICPVVGDFAGDLRWPLTSRRRRIGFFPGSTIGNFRPHEAREFLARTTSLLSGGALLIGVDLVKSTALLHAAYNDAAGLTAAFNRNLLVRANRETGASFDISGFEHYAFYNPVLQRIEMYLISTKRQRVSILGCEFSFAEGEPVLTEWSYKYTVEGFRALAASAGFVSRAVWCDPENMFSIHWLDAA